MWDHRYWDKVPGGPSGLFRCRVCRILKWRDACSGKWRYYADQETRKRWKARPTYARRNVAHVVVTLVSPNGWVRETYQWPPGYGNSKTVVLFARKGGGR